MMISMLDIYIQEQYSNSFVFDRVTLGHRYVRISVWYL